MSEEKPEHDGQLWVSTYGVPAARVGELEVAWREQLRRILSAEPRNKFREEPSWRTR
jgi:hypothetical protein